MKDKFLEKYNIRKTQTRKEILKAISSLKRSHFSVEDILNYLRRKKSDVSRASVYRTIKLFLKKGFLRPTDLGRDSCVYEFTFNKNHHDHLYCIRCGKIIEFKEQAIEEQQLKVCKKFGFKPLSHGLRISGLCKECKE